MTCEVGGLTNNEAREAVIRYFDDYYNLPYDVIYPNQEPPALEGRDSPFIILTIDDVKKEQTGMGERSYITDKFLDITLWIREYTGIKEISNFKDFVDSLGLLTEAQVVYGVPMVVSPKDYKGWIVNTILLPFKF